MFWGSQWVCEQETANRWQYRGACKNEIGRLTTDVTTNTGMSGNLTTGAIWDGSLGARKVRIGYTGKCLE